VNDRAGLARDHHLERLPRMQEDARRADAEDEFHSSSVISTAFYRRCWRRY